MTHQESEPHVEPDAAPVDDAAPADEIDPPAARRLFRRRRRDVSETSAASVDEGAVTPPPEADTATDTTDGPAPKAAKPQGRASLKRDRRRLGEEHQESQFHLGGLALELFRRDALNDPVLSKKAAEVIDIEDRVRLLDWRLEAIETERRQRKGAEPPVAGSCLSCGADFAPGSVFCWRCGTRFAPNTEAESALTTEIGALKQ